MLGPFPLAFTAQNVVVKHALGEIVFHYPPVPVGATFLDSIRMVVATHAFLKRYNREPLAFTRPFIVPKRAFRFLVKALFPVSLRLVDGNKL